VAGDPFQGPFSLPGLRTACALTAENLRSGQSVVVRTGAWLDPIVAADEIASGSPLADFARVPVPATEPPDAALSAALGLDVRLVLLGEPCECNAWQVLVVSDLDALPDGELRAWYEAAERWARQAQGALSTGRKLPPMLLCHRGRTRVPAPTVNVLLANIALHRRLTDLDLRYFVRAQSGGSDADADIWREYVLPPLAGPDLGLVDALWDACLHGQDTLLNACRAYATAQGWSGDEPRDELAGSQHVMAGRDPRPHLAHAVVAGDDHVLDRRIWRGQAALVLPLLDELRLWLCERLQSKLGDGWALRWARPQSVEEEALVRGDPLHAQFGHLFAITDAAPLGADEKATLRKLAVLARDLRNDLAHYRPIRFTRFADLLAKGREAGWA
jgi:hypothetical protein